MNDGLVIHHIDDEPETVRFIVDLLDSEFNRCIPGRRALKLDTETLDVDNTTELAFSFRIKINSISLDYNIWRDFSHSINMNNTILFIMDVMSSEKRESGVQLVRNSAIGNIEELNKIQECGIILFTAYPNEISMEKLQLKETQLVIKPNYRELLRKIVSTVERVDGIEYYV